MYGKHACIEALKNTSRSISEIYVTRKFIEEHKGILNKHSNLCTIIEDDDITRLCSNDKSGRKENISHQGICMHVDVLDSADWYDIAKNKSDATIVILDQITDTQNLGAIIRSSAAFGVDCILLAEYNSVYENAFVAKSACGTLEHVGIAHVVNFARTIKTLKDFGFWIVGLDGNAQENLSNKHFAEKTCIMLGSEGLGLRRLSKENCDFLAKIPMTEYVESINVSNAAAIALYHRYLARG